MGKGGQNQKAQTPAAHQAGGSALSTAEGGAWVRLGEIAEYNGRKIFQVMNSFGHLLLDLKKLKREHPVFSIVQHFRAPFKIYEIHIQ